MCRFDKPTDKEKELLCLKKRLRGRVLRYRLFDTQDGFCLSIKYGSDLFQSKNLPKDRLPEQVTDLLFRMSVTPCTAEEVLQDLSYAEIS